MNPKNILAWTVPITFVAVIVGLSVGEDRRLTESAVAAMAAILGAIVNGVMSNQRSESSSKELSSEEESDEGDSGE